MGLEEDQPERPDVASKKEKKRKEKKKEKRKEKREKKKENDLLGLQDVFRTHNPKREFSNARTSTRLDH